MAERALDEESEELSLSLGITNNLNLFKSLSMQIFLLAERISFFLLGFFLHFKYEMPIYQ